VVTTYFAEGFPYSLVRVVSSVFFKDSGASLQAVGLTSLYGLPWVLKFAWAPFVDAFSTKRRWVVAMETALAATLAGMALGLAGPAVLPVMSAVFIAAAILAATHDAAVDGFYLEALDKQAQARWVGFQAMSFRVALILGGGGVVYLSGRAGWAPAWFCWRPC